VPSSDQHDGQDGTCRGTDTNDGVGPGCPRVFRTEHLEGENDDGDVEHAGEEMTLLRKTRMTLGRDSRKARNPTKVICTAFWPVPASAAVRVWTLHTKIVPRKRRAVVMRNTAPVPQAAAVRPAISGPAIRPRFSMVPPAI
jgi:hypothetical protein